MDFGHVADLAAPDHLGALPRAFVRVALVAHLRGHFVLVGGLHHHARFLDGAHQRLLRVDVLPALHAVDRRGGVHVVRNGHDHGIDAVAFLVQHLAEIFVLGRLLELLVDVRRLLVVHVA